MVDLVSLFVAVAAFIVAIMVLFLYLFLPGAQGPIGMTGATGAPCSPSAVFYAFGSAQTVGSNEYAKFTDYVTSDNSDDPIFNITPEKNAILINKSGTYYIHYIATAAFSLPNILNAGCQIIYTDDNNKTSIAIDETLNILRFPSLNFPENNKGYSNLTGQVVINLTKQNNIPIKLYLQNPLPTPLQLQLEVPNSIDKPSTYPLNIFIEKI